MKNKKKQWKNKKKKTIKDREEKQIKAIKTVLKQKILEADQKSIAFLFSNNFLNEKTTYEWDKIVEIENKFNRNDLIYKTGNKKKDKLKQ